jgi:hypothetical protein
VIPDANTGANSGQCAAVSTQVNGQAMNQLRCTFDASVSTPNPGITAYTWTFQTTTGTATFTGVSQHNLALPCGSFGAADRPVMLTVVAAGGTNSTTKTVTFVKPNAC